MLRLLPFLTLLCFSIVQLNAQSCPDCETTIPAELPADTVYLSSAANGQVGVMYDQDISFRLPLTTTPVADENTPAGLPINQFEITGVANLPPGLEWTPNQTIFDPSELNDGCAKLCGTPLVAGDYVMQVSLVATVFVINAETILDVPITIAPSQSMTDGFTMRNSIGCGETTVSFRNNIPSNGQEGYSYQWDFGNGQMTDRENPLDVEYIGAGKYIVDYQAVVDTTGHFLTNVTIQSVECDDLIGGPDLQVKIFDETGTEVFASAVADNANLPLNVAIDFEIVAESYTLSIFDADGGLAGADDLCIEVALTPLVTGTYTEETATAAISYNILHPTDTIRSQDTVVVYAIPLTPEITVDGALSFCDGETTTLVASYDNNIQWYRDTSALVNETNPSLAVETTGQYFAIYTSPEGCISTSDTVVIVVNEIPMPPSITVDGALSLCTGDSTLLTASYTDNLQWYLDGELLSGAVDANLIVQIAGNYTATYTSPEGCTSTSESIIIEVNELPAIPNFTVENNTLMLLDTNTLSTSASLQWYLNGNAITDATQTTFCIAETGVYGLEITNEAACTAYAEMEISYDENFPNCVSNVAEIEDLTTNFKLYPNPVADILNVEFFVSQNVDIELLILNSIGQVMYQTNKESILNAYQNTLSIAHLSAGIYYLKIKIGAEESSVKFVKK